MDDNSAYFRLKSPREVDGPKLPADLVRFYAYHEGVGIESEPDRAIRLCRLSEVAKIGWKDLHILGEDEPTHEGWSAFDGFRVGYSDTLDEIVYVISAPGIRSGSVMALGESAMVGPPGDDADGPYGAIVLADSFGAWVQRLEGRA
jgi:hypothetical protein